MVVILVAFTSRTGNVRRFVGRLDLPLVEIGKGVCIDSSFMFVTYTTGFGQVPEAVYEFLDRNKRHLVGVAASGNKNWGSNFAKAGDTLAEKYGVPLLLKFELSGTSADVELLLKKVKSFETHRVK